ncbi:ATP-binding protein [Streptosporangium saharense]|uniref:ATP-binding protein n=1 Tax=Streptosporangium saharense TaxID=1706840 RepID=UPI003678A134
MMSGTEPGADIPSERQGATRSELSGRAGDVVQARDVSGGIHFHDKNDNASPREKVILRQLPGDVRDFVNRTEELGRLDAILAEDTKSSRFSTVCAIVGTAGVGKTSFAVHWAHRMLGHFPDGQLYINLRGYDPDPLVTPDQALERFLAALGVPSAAIPAELESRAGLYRSCLAGRRILVILDNAFSAAQVRPLLPGTPGCLVLVTSRDRLSGLVARDGARRLSLRMLEEPEAISLVRSLVRDHRPAEVSEEVAELSQLCARLPLALRIAAERAARRPLTPLRELIDELRDESALWDALSVGDDEESDAVRGVFAWSYRALSESAGQLFRLLGLHPGPEFSSQVAAELAEIPLNRARRLLDDLVGAHLLEQQSSDRYQFHDLLRAYAVDQVRHEEDPGAQEKALQRVLLWYLRQADSALSRIAPGAARVPLATMAGGTTRTSVFAGYTEAIQWYGRERANLVAAVRSAMEARFHDIAWQLPATLYRIYAKLNHFDDWRTTSEVAFAAVRETDDRAGLALILESLAKMHTQSHRLDEGIALHQEALAVRREIGDHLGEVSSLNGTGLALLRAHRLTEARSFFEETYALAVQLGSRGWEAVATNCLAYVHMELGELEEADSLHRRALELHRELGDREAEGDALRCASLIRRSAGDAEGALAAIESALVIAQEVDNHAFEGFWLIDLGRVQIVLGRPEEAIDSLHRAAVLHRRIGDRSREALSWDATGEAYRELGRRQEAIDFHRRAAAVFRELGDRWLLAGSLTNLAVALKEDGRADEADTYLREAENALVFDDPAARRLRERVRSLMSGPRLSSQE